MKTFLFISDRGESLPIALKVFDEGNRVLFCTPNEHFEPIGHGLIERINTSQLPSLKPDVVIFDRAGLHSDDADIIKEKGILVYGTSAFGDQLAMSKSYGQKVLKTHGIKVPTAYLFEPDSTEFVDVVTELLFSSNEPLSVVYSFDEITLMEGGIGPSCAMGSASKIGRLSDRLYTEGLGKLIQTLKKSNFSGHISARFLVTKNGIFGYELIPYFNYNTIFSFLEGFKGSISDLISTLALGNAKKPILRNDWFISTKVAGPPFPYAQADASSKGEKIKGLNEHNLKHTWFSDVYMNGNGRCVAGSNGDIGFVSARGETIREARRRVYRTIGNISVPSMIYRRDIGERVSEDYFLLNKWGWLKN